MMDDTSTKSAPLSSKSPEAPPHSAWLLLGVAVAFEIIGAIGLRFSEGFSVMLPTIVALTAFAVALYLVSRVMKALPVSIAYPVWAGGGTAGVALIGILALGEELNAEKAVGVVLVVIGVVLVNMVSEKAAGC
ncbi:MULTISPECIES: DMT family transporter [Vibrio harveyi group]|uniref:DMT family transporter n=1 Tax=Vibrio harveyi group TaxID=717610 RepID=UPI001F07BD02|nr:MULTISPECIES: multidrug efflux SMR transporter [Vibrio harveyi group]MEA5376663.1 multidrug efflux SMR transporter [Vibrio parahaemolyticus]UMM06741.1 multidrug efflux SMR transporter [Vibrio campbellii]